MLLNQPGEFGPDVPPTALRNEALVVQEIKNGGQEIWIESGLLAFGKKNFEEQVDVSHERRYGGVFKYLQPT
jgi:hypothetical protein